MYIGGDGVRDYLTVDSQTHRLLVPRTMHTLVLDAEEMKPGATGRPKRTLIRSSLKSGRKPSCPARNYKAALGYQARWRQLGKLVGTLAMVLRCELT